MKFQFLPLTVAGCLAAGLGFGYGLTASGQPFVLEARDTPLGSFFLRGNLSPADPSLIPGEENPEHDWLNHVAQVYIGLVRS